MTVKVDKKIVNATVVTEETLEPAEEKKPEVKRKKKEKRPDILWGVTAKIITPECNIYVTVNCNKDSKPLEIFLFSSHLESQEYVALVTRISSAMLRSDDSEVASLDFIAKEFIKTESPGKYMGKVLDSKKGEMHNGIIPHIGKTLLAINKRLKAKAKMVDVEAPADKPVEPTSSKLNTSAGTCPECYSDNTTLMDNCLTCLDCGFSKCG